jgi:hypothetical protein
MTEGRDLQKAESRLSVFQSRSKQSISRYRYTNLLDIVFILVLVATLGVEFGPFEY